MIGLFARMFKRDERIVQVDELEDESGYEIKAHGPSGENTVVMGDQGPDGFVEEVEYDGGNVVVAPLVEALRQAFRRKGQNGEETDETD